MIEAFKVEMKISLKEVKEKTHKKWKKSVNTLKLRKTKQKSKRKKFKT